MIVLGLVLAVLALLAPTTIAALLAAHGVHWVAAALIGTFILVCIGMGLRGPTKPPE